MTCLIFILIFPPPSSTKNFLEKLFTEIDIVVDAFGNEDNIN